MQALKDENAALKKQRHSAGGKGAAAGNRQAAVDAAEVQRLRKLMRQLQTERDKVWGGHRTWRSCDGSKAVVAGCEQGSCCTSTIV